MQMAPALQRVLGVALQEGGWFDLGHNQAVREATGQEDPRQRVREMQTLLAEETRLGMLVGVAVGFELARELGAGALHAQETGSVPGAGTEEPTKQEDG